MFVDEVASYGYAIRLSSCRCGGFGFSGRISVSRLFYIAVTLALSNGQKIGIIVYLVYLSFDCTAVVTTPSLSVPSSKLGYKPVADNIDIGVKTRYMRLERYVNKFLHYFHCFAIQNRIDHSD